MLIRFYIDQFALLFIPLGKIVMFIGFLTLLLISRLIVNCSNVSFFSSYIDNLFLFLLSIYGHG